MTMQSFVALIADGTIFLIIAIAGYALLFLVAKERRFEVYARILMAGLTAYLLAKLLGAVYQPSGERPFEAMGVSAGASYLDNPGFPSDHALFAAFLTFAVWYGTGKKKLVGVLASLTVVMCIGRVLALVHTPLDVIGGMVIAGIGALWYLQEKPLHSVAKKAKK